MPKRRALSLHGYSGYVCCCEGTVVGKAPVGLLVTLTVLNAPIVILVATGVLYPSLGEGEAAARLIQIDLV